MSTNIPIHVPDPFDAWPSDASNLDEAHEIAREEALEEFTEWQRADYDRREFEDFGNWLANKARWNQPNIYQTALTYAERGHERLTDPELVAHSQNHHRFLRENRRAGGSR